MIDGVCGGIAAYFSVDPTLIRIVWVLLALFGGSGVILYIAAMILMPKEDLGPASVTRTAQKPRSQHEVLGDPPHRCRRVLADGQHRISPLASLVEFPLAHSSAAPADSGRCDVHVRRA